MLGHGHARRAATGFSATRPGEALWVPRTEPEGDDFMSDTLKGKTVAFLVAPEGIEQVELTEPWKAVQEAGGTPTLVSTDSGTVQGYNHLDKADTFDVDTTVEQAKAADYDGLVLPGGVANPDYLRTQPKAVAYAKAFFDGGRPVAAICHAPWTLVEADVVRGRRVTS